MTRHRWRRHVHVTRHRWRRHVRVHLLLWLSCWVQALRRELQFRSQAFLNGLFSVLDLGLSLLPVLILTRDAGAASGWAGPRAVVVVGVYGACSGLIDCLVTPNLRRIDGYVRRGDLVLVRPVNALLYTALRWIAPAELGKVVTGFGLISAGFLAGDLRVDAGAALAATVCAVAGTAGFALLWANLAYLAFWIDSAEPVNEIAVQLRQAGTYPLGYFPRPVQLLLTTIVPARRSSSSWPAPSRRCTGVRRCADTAARAAEPPRSRRPPTPYAPAGAVSGMKTRISPGSRFAQA